MSTSATIKNSIVDAHGTKTFVRTDGAATISELQSRMGEPKRDIAIGLDVGMAAMQQLGAALDLGALKDVVITFSTGVLIGARGSDDSVLAVVADSDCNVGLLLNQIRRFMNAAEGEEKEG